MAIPRRSRPSRRRLGRSRPRALVISSARAATKLPTASHKRLRHASDPARNAAARPPSRPPPSSPTPAGQGWVMADYDETFVAGDESFYLSGILSDMSSLVGIAPPVIQGRQLYNEHDVEAWSIKTFIPGSDDDLDDPGMTYTDVYPDWTNSVEIAIQGAIARIRHKFHRKIPPTSPYYQFGERAENGTPLRRMGARNLAREVLQYANVRNMQMEAALAVDDKRLALEERIALLEDPVKLEEKIIISDNWAKTVQKTITLMLENRAIETKEKDELKKENDALKMENKLLKETIEELAAGKEEEDPQERLMFNSDGEVEPVAEGKKKKRKTSSESYPLSCLETIKRR
ncbi:hypothetical protein QYE76_064328 [Lolium multiflorum]|uniref:Uncharacterized protein n=1 Tax=Lolium multiflorum TaxID=4521 RepID=A0AAD8S7G4_LOLMU|nr:hypothetical protein QYE76_064328 [Lolium multiflorum]